MLLTEKTWSLAKCISSRIGKSSKGRELIVLATLLAVLIPVAFFLAGVLDQVFNGEFAPYDEVDTLLRRIRLFAWLPLMATIAVLAGWVKSPDDLDMETRLSRCKTIYWLNAFMAMLGVLHMISTPLIDASSPVPVSLPLLFVGIAVHDRIALRALKAEVERKKMTV